VEHFLFKVLCETAKLLWSSTYLFRDGIPGMERQQNYRNIEQVLNEGILQAVRNLVPVKSILKDFMNMDVAAEHAAEEDSDEEEEKTVKSSDDMVVPSAVSLSSDIPVESSKKEEKKGDNEVITATADTMANTVTAIATHAKTVAPAVTAAIATQVAPILVEPKESLISTISSAITNAFTPETIIINDKPAVSFGKYNTVFNTEHPEESDLIIDAREDESYDEIPALEIMDEEGQPLGDNDFDTLDGVQSIGAGDYEEL
jgi:hypothetical protein